METYRIELEPHDDLLSARDKIGWSSTRRVLLVWPRRGRVLERRIDLLLLQRACQRLGAQLAVVSRQPQVRANARDLGVSVFQTVGQAERQSWRSPAGTRLFWLAARHGSARRAQVLGDLRSRRAALPRPALLPTWQRLAVFFGALLACAALLALLWPSATVTLPVQRRQQALAISGWADPALASLAPAGGLPGAWLQVTVEGRRQAAVRGTTRAPASFAGGLVVIQNQSDAEVLLPRGSALTAEGQRFHTTLQARLAAGARLNVQVQAEQPGSAANLPPGTPLQIEGPLSFALQAGLEQALSGGAERLAPAPSRAETAALREALLDDLRASALAELHTLAGAERQLLAHTLEIESVLDEQQDPLTGAPGHTLTLALRVQFRVLAVRRAEADQLAQTALDAALPQGWRAVGGTLRLEEPAPFQADGLAEGAAGWQLNAARQIEPDWNADDLRLALRGRTLAQALAQLSALPLAQPASITTFPAWWGRLPLLPGRIQVIAP